MIAWNFQRIVGTCQFRVPWFGYPCGYSSLTFFINVLCLHIDMKNTSKSPLLLYSEDLDEGIDYKDIQLFKFYESVSEHLRIS